MRPDDATKYAWKFVEFYDGEPPAPTDEALAAAFANCVRPAKPGEYVVIRAALDELRENATPLPSGDYAYRVEGDAKPVLRVLVSVRGRWVPTPGQWYAVDLLDLGPRARLAIDFGNAWSLDTEDTAALADAARRLAT